jgi:hypothetical protein
MKTKIFVLFALVAGTFAAGNMKAKLAQMNANTLAQSNNLGSDVSNGCDISFADLPAVDLPECPCEFA